jgi:cleavage and polyadenylation specificity factor subunit 2
VPIALYPVLTFLFAYRQIPTVSVILLTHATVSHIGAFAHCCKHFPLFSRIPVYATTPVIQLGRTLLQDLYGSTPLAATIIPPSSLSESSYTYKELDGERSDILLQPPTHEEIASYFSLIHPLKYSQPHQPLPSPFSPPLNGLTITAYNAGHTLGGTIWHIQHGLESIIYAVGWNQARENILAGAAWLGGAGSGGAEVIEQLRKPTALICSSWGATKVALSGGLRRRDDTLLSMIRSTVAKGGTVLIPTDSSARVLELAYLLEHAWRKEASDEKSPLHSAPIYLASKNVGATMRYARSMLEWMDDSIVREFEALAGGAQRGHNAGQNTKPGAGPFDFKYIRLLERKGQVSRILNSDETKHGNPVGKVILASDTSMEWGFSKDVLRKTAEDSRNLVILTERPVSGANAHAVLERGLARTLWTFWEERRDGVALEPGPAGDSIEQVYGGGRELQLTEPKRLPLEGRELAAYQQWLATQRQLQTTLQPDGGLALDGAADAAGDESDTSSDTEGSETEQQGKALNMATTLGTVNRKKIGLSDEDLGVNILIRRKGVYDYDVRNKKGRERMFPLVVRRKKADDFGELIRPDEYLRAEERDEIDGQDMREDSKINTQDTLGKKRKWDDSTSPTDGNKAAGANKRQQTGKAGSPEAMDSYEPHESNGVPEDDGEEPTEEEVIGPAKVSYSTTTITLHSRLAYVDFTGLHDKRSLQMLIPLIQPRKLVLVSGMADEIFSLAEDCRKLLGSGSGESQTKGVDVYTPNVGVTVNASVDTNAWAVKLSDELVKRLKWQKVRGFGIVTLTGRLSASGMVETSQAAGTITSGEPVKAETTDLVVAKPTSTEVAEPGSTLPVLDVVPVNMASATRSVAQPLHVGDLRLTDLRKLMLASGYTAEFRGEGTLLINGSVAVRKLGTGKIEVEALGTTQSTGRTPEGSTFYVVKKKIYEGLAVVAGG